jgi:hypothetical protein
MSAVLLVPAARAEQHSALAEILLRKRIISPDDMKQLDEATTPQQAEEMLARILMAKGVLSKGEYEQIAGIGPVPTSPAAPQLAPKADAMLVKPPAPAVAQQPVAPASGSSGSTRAPVAHATAPVERPAAPAIVAALAPVRVLPVGGMPRPSGETTVKISNVGIATYGALKATAVFDSSSPYGDDFPLPGFINDSGPDGASEFHLKARSSKLGLNVAWLDSNPKWSITGKLEMDFEGNFNRSDNRNISTIRSSNPSLRLAWGRMDYSFNDKNTISALFGQDWSPFGSSTLPSNLETTAYGIGYGILYERIPQMRLGYTRKMGGVQVMSEFAMTQPAAGLAPAAANISQQLAYGERQGSDTGRPDFEARIVTQWQLDKSAGVAPAQIIFSGMQGSRTAIVPAASIPTAYQKAFATGAKASSNTWGGDFEAQLPTRYATLVGKFYSGGDLRFFLVNQLYSYFSDTAGLSNLVCLNSIDGSSTVYLGTNAAGAQVVAPQRPIRTTGGWAQLGLPLSRIFHAGATGRNAGWSLYALYSVDQAKTRDLVRLGSTGNRRYSTMAVGTLNYQFSKWLTFSFEQSLYTTHANPELPLPIYKGVLSREWNDVREEFGPTFTF